MKARHIPNLICVFRILLVMPVVLSLLHADYLLALLLFALAGASDGLDGFLARRFDWRSRLGAIVDPLADKLLMLCSYSTLAYLGLLPLWLVALVLGRDLVIVLGALAYHRLRGGVEMAPTGISKLNTLLQILLVVAVMAQAAAMALPAWLVTLLLWLTTLTTLASGVHYVWAWSRRAHSNSMQG